MTWSRPQARSPLAKLYVRRPGCQAQEHIGLPGSGKSQVRPVYLSCSLWGLGRWLCVRVCVSVYK